MGYLPLPGITFYAGIATVNLLSLDLWEQHGMSYEKRDDTITVYSPDGRAILTSRRNPNGLYTCTYRDLLAAGSRLHAPAPRAASTTTSAHRRIVRRHGLSADEVQRAHEALRLHENCGHPSDGVLSTALDHGNLRDCNLTSQDVRNMRALMGPCAACYEGKATIPRTAPGMPPSSAPCQLLHIDPLEYRVATMGGYKWALVVVDDYSGFILIIGMKTKHAVSIRDALKTLIQFYNEYRHPVLTLMMDAEHTLTAQAPFLSEQGIRILPQIAGLHEKVVERGIRTLKDRERTITAALTYELPAVLGGERRSYAAERINAMPNYSTGTRSNHRSEAYCD